MQFVSTHALRNVTHSLSVQISGSPLRDEMDWCLATDPARRCILPPYPKSVIASSDILHCSTLIALHFTAFAMYCDAIYSHFYDIYVTYWHTTYWWRYQRESVRRNPRIQSAKYESEIREFIQRTSIAICPILAFRRARLANCAKVAKTCEPNIDCDERVIEQVVHERNMIEQFFPRNVLVKINWKLELATIAKNPSTCIGQSKVT